MRLSGHKVFYLTITILRFSRNYQYRHPGYHVFFNADIEAPGIIAGSIQSEFEETKP